MRLVRSLVILVIFVGMVISVVTAQRGRQGRGGVAIMPLTTPAWPDGLQIPVKYTQAGEEASPPLTWSNVPEGTASFVLLFHDVNVATGDGSDDLLHWLLWNIPGSARELQEGLPQGSELPDGTRQISVSGPYYRGPAAPVSGPVHHYIFELFALDKKLDVQPIGSSPAQTRAAVLEVMARHVLGKAVYAGQFQRR